MSVFLSVFVYTFSSAISKAIKIPFVTKLIFGPTKVLTQYHKKRKSRLKRTKLKREHFMNLVCLNVKKLVLVVILTLVSLI